MKKKDLLKFKNFLFKKIIKKIKKENNKIISSKIIFSSKSKKQIDPVTKFDLSVEKIIRNEIKKKFPDHNIIGEEFDLRNGGSKFTWIIDPIDGTKALIAGQPTWSNLISLYYNNEPVFGMANFPVLNKIYYGDRFGSYLIEKKKTRIQSSKLKFLKNAKLITNSIHTFVNNKIYKFFKSYPYFFKISGVDAYNFCLLSEGKIDIIIESGLKQVDILPMVPIIEASGGIITNWSGKKDLSKGQIIVSSNKTILVKFLNYFNKNYNNILKK